MLLEHYLVVGRGQVAGLDADLVERGLGAGGVADQARLDGPIAGAECRVGDRALGDLGHAINGGHLCREIGWPAGEREVGHVQLHEHLVVRRLQVAPGIERGAEEGRAE